jgi:hypothetical protein
MRSLRKTLKKQSVYLFSEFIIIVLGVLVALAVDEWRDENAMEQRRLHLLSSLLVDLKDDQNDYQNFVRSARQRHQIVRQLTSSPLPDQLHLSDTLMSLGEGLFQVGLSDRLQTHRGAFQETTATGSRIVVENDALRIQLLQYYALATDRARVNEFIAPELSRYHQALENIGVSYADRDEIDVDAVLNDPTSVAIIKNIGETARFVQSYCRDLIEANINLITTLEAELADP